MQAYACATFAVHDSEINVHDAEILSCKLSKRPFTFVQKTQLAALPRKLEKFAKLPIERQFHKALFTRDCEITGEVIMNEVSKLKCKAYLERLCKELKAKGRHFDSQVISLTIEVIFHRINKQR